ncbi:hypothetical protein OTK51_14905, partial [Vibrio scophthalmi]|uniref:hypothetical protein n=1 Tax=Vibrio scophthalmi TaxID=45658 RepID=UPI002283DC3A
PNERFSLLNSEDSCSYPATTRNISPFQSKIALTFTEALLTLVIYHTASLRNEVSYEIQY